MSNRDARCIPLMCQLQGIKRYAYVPPGRKTELKLRSSSTSIQRSAFSLLNLAAIVNRWPLNSRRRSRKVDGQFEVPLAAWLPNDDFMIVRRSDRQFNGILVEIARRALHEIAQAPPRCFRDPREQQAVRSPLMVLFAMIVRNVLMHRLLQRSFAEKMMFDTPDLIGALRRYGPRVGASRLDDRTEGNGVRRLTIMEKTATASKALHPFMFTFRCVLEDFFLVVQ